MLLTAAGTVAAILFGVWKMIGSTSTDLRSEIRENRHESTREHEALDAKFTSQFQHVDQRFNRVESDIGARFNILDERDRRRLRAMLE